MTQSAQFEQVFRTAKRIRFSKLIFNFCRNESGFARIGIGVAKKYIRHATARNRIKRIIRESFRQQQIVKNLDIVIIVRSDFNALTKTEQRSYIDSRWEKINF